jgi:hypothetical protein
MGRENTEGMEKYRKAAHILFDIGVIQFPVALFG